MPARHPPPYGRPLLPLVASTLLVLLGVVGLLWGVGESARHPTALLAIGLAGLVRTVHGGPAGRVCSGVLVAMAAVLLVGGLLG